MLNSQHCSEPTLKESLENIDISVVCNWILTILEKWFGSRCLVCHIFNQNDQKETQSEGPTIAFLLLTK